jgi:hypothetical protein
MAYTIDTTSTDAYQELQCPGTIRVTAQISNAAISINYGQGGRGRPDAAVYPPGDEVLLPSFGGLDRQCDAIRFKSYAAGTPANVKLTAIPGPPGGG